MAQLFIQSFWNLQGWLRRAYGVYTPNLKQIGWFLNLLVVFFKKKMTLYLYIGDTYIGRIIKLWCNEHDCINDFMINNI